MSKGAQVGLLALIIICGWPLLGARAQEGSGQGAGHVLIHRGQPTHGTVPPGQVGGPVLNHPELNTPEHRKEEAEEAKVYCQTHKCGSMRSYGPGAEKSLDRALHRNNPEQGNPSDTTVCYTDPAHPNGPDLCYRASDGSRVYPGTPGPN